MNIRPGSIVTATSDACFFDDHESYDVDPEILMFKGSLGVALSINATSRGTYRVYVMFEGHVGWTSSRILNETVIEPTRGSRCPSDVSNGLPHV